jgi:copper transport protein
VPAAPRVARILSLLAALAMAAVALLFSAGPAAAHADLTGTSPRSGQVLDVAPGEVTVRFDDTVDLNTAQIRVLEPNGAPLAGVSAPRHPNGDHKAISATLPKGLGDGARTVVYRVASSDGHPVQGSFAFGIGVGGSTAAPDTLAGGGGALGVLYGIARWSAFLGLAMFVGTAFFVGVCWPAGVRRPRARALFWGGGAALAAATATSLLLYAPYVTGGSLGDVADLGSLRTTLHTRVGGLLAARLVLVGLLAAAALVVLRRVGGPGDRGGDAARQADPAPDAGPPPSGDTLEPVGARRGGVSTAAAVQVAPARVTSRVPDVEEEPEPALAGVLAAGVLVGGGALAATWSLATHSAVGPGLVIALPVDVAHLLAMSVWLGGLPVLLAVLLPARDPVALNRVVPQFSRIAQICVVSLVLTGIYQAWRQVGSPSALRGTSYGAVLLVKVAAVAVVVVLGARARAWTGSHVGVARAVDVGRRPRPARGPSEEATGRFRRIVAAESAIAVVILGLTASLVSLQPARSAHAADVAAAAAKAPALAIPVAAAVAQTLPMQLEGKDKTKGASGWVDAEISPAAGGLPNELHISVTNSKGRPLAVQTVLVDLRVRDSAVHSQQFPLAPSGEGHYFAPFNVPHPARYDMGVTVRAADGSEDLVLVPFDAH